MDEFTQFALKDCEHFLVARWHIGICGVTEVQVRLDLHTVQPTHSDMCKTQFTHGNPISVSPIGTD